MWAGTPETYAAVHPRCDAKLFDQVSRALQKIGDAKREAQIEHPEIRIYNVLCNLNHHEIADMVDFALSVDADAVEFTVMDTLPGETDHLALSKRDEKAIVKQLLKIHPRLLFSGWKRTRTARFLPVTDAGELSVFGYLDRAKHGGGHQVRTDWGLELDDGEITYDYAMRGGWNQIRAYRSANVARSQAPSGTPPDRAACTVRLLAVVGVGTLLRLVAGREDHSALLDLGDGHRCYVGWLFSRIRANGDVIPCCKACKLPAGNIYEESFSGIWHGEKMTEFRNHALYLPKSHPYFAPISCSKGCDNAGMNIATHKRVAALAACEKATLVKRALSPKEGVPS